MNRLRYFKKFCFGVVVIYIISNKTLPNRYWSTNSLVQPIFFFSRLFTTIQKINWLTELEIMRFFQVFKKIRYLIEFSWTQIIIQTDYLAILDILQQSSIIITISIIRLNLWLVGAYQFLQQFKLNVRHKLKKKYIIVNILNQLANINCDLTNPSHSEFEAFFVYNITLVEIYSTLMARIPAKYNTDTQQSQF